MVLVSDSSAAGTGPGSPDSEVETQEWHLEHQTELGSQKPDLADWFLFQI